MSAAGAVRAGGAPPVRGVEAVGWIPRATAWAAGASAGVPPGSVAVDLLDAAGFEIGTVFADFACEFSGDRPLPVVAVDEPVCRRLSAFLIATVDKFASPP